ncbi:hypothetical protein [Metabacillus sp. 84]|uniref:hypothetical protein n=1 Tax=Metabacillus sp. 84 TaxID=3404705 RepID=UPI003CEDB391
MEKMTKISGMFTVAFLIAGCSSSGEEENSQTADFTENKTADSQEVEGTTEDNGEDNVDSDGSSDTEEGSSDDGSTEKMDTSEGETNEETNTNEETGSSDEKGGDTEVYGGAQLNPNYFIDTQVISQDKSFYIAYSIDRDRESEEMISPEQRLETSLFNNDPSEQDILNSYADLTLDWPSLYVEFSQQGSELDATSAQSRLFYESLFGISDLHGIEDVTLLNPGGETRVTVAQRTFDDAVVVKEERGATRGYYAVYDKELQETLFIAGGPLEEQIVNDSGEPMTFPETIEKMKSVEGDVFYSSAVADGIEILDSSITNGVAQVQYTMDKNSVTDADRTVFENAVQLAALDFHAWEVEIMNDTLKESRTYPLVGQ